MTTVSVLDRQAPLAPTTRLESAFAPTSTPGNDRDALISAAVKGGAAAIDDVLRWIRPLVLRYCRTRVGGQVTSADDVAQEVCIATLTALPGYRYQGRQFLTLVYGIAAHKVADAHRLAAPNRVERVSDVPDTKDLADSPATQALNHEFAGWMGLGCWSRCRTSSAKSCNCESCEDFPPTRPPTLWARHQARFEWLSTER